MNTDEIKARVVSALASVAPEADASAIRGGADLRDELDIDSMDFLRFLGAVHRDLGVSVPEEDYPRVRTLDDCVAYLAKKLG